MATASSGWKTTHSTSVKEETNTNKTVRVTCKWTNDGHKYDINHVYGYVYCVIDGVKNKQEVFTDGSVDAQSSNTQSVSLGSYDFVIPKGTSEKNVECYAKITSESSYVSGTKYSTATTVSVPAKPYHTITYDANGGTGAPASQTKWYSESITLSTTKPTRTGYSFVRWNTNTSNTGTAYAPGATYSSNANLTLYAIWSPNTYTVTYNANGGTGAPANQTKTHDVDLTLSSTKPTRTNYNFLGWSTSASGDAVYSAGGKYTNNSAITLYAVWELGYLKPRITNFTAQRCNSSGTVTDSGTYIKVAFNWVTDKTVTEIKMEWKTQTGTTWSNKTVSASGTSGSVSQVIGSGAISTDTSYVVKASVSDSGGTTPSPTATIGSKKYPIDVKKGGTGVSIGKAAETDNLFDVALHTKLANGVDITGDVNINNGNVTISGNTGDIDTVGSINATGDINTSGSVDVIDGYKQNGVTFIRHSGINTIISAENGGNIYLRPNGDNDDVGRVLIKTDGTITAFGGTTRIYGAKILYDNTSGTNGSVTLSDSVENYDYIEILYRNNDNAYNSVKVYNPNGKIAQLISSTIPSTSWLYHKATLLNISGTTISVKNGGESAIKSSGATHTTSNSHYIVRVLGCK